MNLKDKAAETPDVDLARDSAPGTYRLLTHELVAADDLTNQGEFPLYGDFLEVQQVGPGGRERFIECPRGLAQWLVEHELAISEAFRVRSVQKIDGEWSYDVERVPGEDGDLNAADAMADDDD